MAGPLRKVLAGSIILTSTSVGAFMAPAPQVNNWIDVRSEFENDSAMLDVTAELNDVLELYHNSQIDLKMAIRLSYIGVASGRLGALDRFWTDLLTSQDTSVSFETLIALRDEAVGSRVSEEDIMRDWLWKASGGRDYDCVAGGGSSNCGTGEGLGGGNGTDNEGGGNG